MKKNALWIILVLAAIAFLAVYTMQQDEGVMIGNTTIVRPSAVQDANEAVDDMTGDADDLAEEVEDVIQGIIDEVEQEIEDGAQAAEEAVDNAGEAIEEATDNNDMEDGEEEMDDTADEETVVVVESNGYVEYDAAMVQEATEAGKDVVLFFHADRCPSCRALEEDVNENVSDINENTVLVKVDYDTAEDLKAQYGVTAQHTLVYLDENGEEKMKERGSMTLTEVQANIEG